MKLIQKSIDSWVILLVALVIGGIAFYMSNVYLTNKEEAFISWWEKEHKPGEKVGIAVAKIDLMPGDVLGNENMEGVQLSPEYLSKFAVRREDFGQYRGRVINCPISSGEPLLSHCVSGYGIRQFSDLLEAGQRAITFGMDEIASNSHMLKAGDYVDILLMAASNEQRNGNQKLIKSLLTQVRVIATDSLSLTTKDQTNVVHNNDGNSYGTITVGVSPENAARLELARDTGKLIFQLRNSEDKQTKAIKTITLNEVLGGKQSQKNSGSSRYQFYSPKGMIKRKYGR